MDEEMDIVKYAEEVLGLELLDYQKDMLRLYSKIPKDHVIVMGRYGRAYLVPKRIQGGDKQ